MHVPPVGCVWISRHAASGTQEGQRTASCAPFALASRVFLEQCKNASSSEDYQHSVRKRLVSSVTSVTHRTAPIAWVGIGRPKDRRAQK